MITAAFDHDSPRLLPIHPLARALPPMTEAEFRALKDDIAFQGQLEPIIVLDGAVLDGIHRQRACHELGLTPRTIEYVGDAPAAFVIARNLRRRHLSVGQQTAVAASLVKYYRTKYPKQGRGGTDLAKVAHDLGIKQVPEDSGTRVQLTDLVAEATDVTSDAIETFEAVRKADAPLAAKVASGEVALYAAEAQLKAAAKEQTAPAAGSRRQTKDEAAREASRALLDAIRAAHSKLRVVESLRRDVDPEYLAGTLKAAEQFALEHRRLVEAIHPYFKGKR